MDKHEILAKAKEEQIDEGAMQAENQGRIAGTIAFLAVYAFIMTFNLYVGAKSNQAVNAMFTAFIAAGAFPKWKFTKRKIFLVLTIAGAILTLLFLVAAVFDTLRVAL